MKYLQIGTPYCTIFCYWLGMPPAIYYLVKTLPYCTMCMLEQVRKIIYFFQTKERPSHFSFLKAISKNVVFSTTLNEHQQNVVCIFFRNKFICLMPIQSTLRNAGTNSEFIGKTSFFNFLVKSHLSQKLTFFVKIGPYKISWSVTFCQVSLIIKKPIQYYAEYISQNCYYQAAKYRRDFMCCQYNAEWLLVRK